jgi:hypothetical protein
MAVKFPFRFFSGLLLLLVGACSPTITYDRSVDLPSAGNRAVLSPVSLRANKPIDFLDFNDGRLKGFCKQFPCENGDEVTLDITEGDLQVLLAGIVSCLSEVKYTFADPLYDTWDCPASGGTGDCEDRACVAERCAIARGVPPGAVTFLYAMRPPKGDTRDTDHMAVLLRTSQGWFVIDTGKLSRALGVREWVSVRRFEKWFLLVRTPEAKWRQVEVVPMNTQGLQMASMF